MHFFVDQTLKFLRRHKDQPCFVNLWPDDVHTPWVPDETHQSKPRSHESEQAFRLTLKEFDRQIGRLMDGLKELGIDEQTLVIFTSDNGAAPTFEGERSAGLRGAKATLYEAGIRVPFIVRWPKHVPAGVVNDKTVLTAVDMFPSLCAVAGVSSPKNAGLEGENLSAAFFGKAASREKPILWEFGRNFHKPNSPDKSPNLAIRDGKWKLLINDDKTSAELYDLNNDPLENDNLAESNPRIVKKLSRPLLKWRASLPRLNTEN